ncbi:MAG: acetyl-CoA acetyltransferase [Stenotrophobium sp.]
MSQAVYILGGYQTDFAKNWSRAGEDISHITHDAVHGVLQACRLEASEIQSIHVGNAFAELQRGQAHMGAMPATVVPQLYGVPAMRHEAACASASVAVLAAMSEIEAGRYDCVLVLGVEEERNTSGDQASLNMNAAAWVGHEQLPGRLPWPSAFGQIAAEYQRRYGLDRRHLHRIAELNFGNAKRNPHAQTRGWQFDAKSFTDDDAVNPVVEAGIRRNECCQITDGACAVVLASENFARAHAQQRGVTLTKVPRILGWGHRTSDLPFAHKLKRTTDAELVFPHVNDAVRDALRRAGCESPTQVDGYEVHDCFALSEYFAIDHIGLTPPGQSWRMVESGDIELGGRLPINPSGGLIGGGHPVGATGTRMLLDACKQVTGEAGDYQVEGARTFATLNIGGSLGTVVSFVVGV